MFIGVHLGLARLTGHEELEITEDEAKSFMTAAQNVARHYSVQTTQKTLDWVAFAGCIASIYGTRAVVIARKDRDDDKQSGPGENVFSIMPNG